jgi:hypothetical protein
MMERHSCLASVTTGVGLDRNAGCGYDLVARLVLPPRRDFDMDIGQNTTTPILISAGSITALQHCSRLAPLVLYASRSRGLMVGDHHEFA